MLHMLKERSTIITLHKKNTNKNSDKKIDANKSNLSKSGKSRKTNEAEIITKICNCQNKMKRKFTTLNTRIEDMENE